MTNFREHSEHPSRGPQAPSEEKKQEKGQSRELRETSKTFGEDVSDVVETAEVMTGAEISERTGEDKKKAAATAGKTGAAAAVQAVLKKKIVIPSVEIMQIQVATAIKNEIRILEKQAQKLARKKNFSPFTLNGMVSKIRELKDMLARITSVTFETLKSWWIKLVKGGSL